MTKNKEKKNVKQKYYEFRMNRILNKPIKEKEFVVFKNCFYMIDTKYVERFQKLAEKFQQLEYPNYKKIFAMRFAYLLAGLGVIELLTGDHLEVIKAKTLYAMEISQENTNSGILDFSCENSEEMYPQILEKEITLDGENVVEIKWNQYLERVALYDSYLKEFSEYYHFDSEKVIEIARNTTNGYEDFSFVLSNNEFDLENPKVACLLFIYYLNHDKLNIDLSTLGISKEELITTDEIETLSYEHTDDLILRTGQKYSKFLGEICDLFNTQDKSMLLAVSFSEMGPQGSYSSRTRNNFGGMKVNGEHMIFPTPEAGIIEMCGNYKKRFDNYDTNSMIEFACYYITGIKTLPDPSENPDQYNEIMRWIQNVASNYSMVQENYDYYFDQNATMQNQGMNLTFTRKTF